MKLTNRNAWHMFAGGTSAASNRHNYVAKLNCGEYHVIPISHPRNVERHLGYRVYFADTTGCLYRGLWQTLNRLGEVTAIGPLMTLPQARKACQLHFEHALSPTGVLLIPQFA